MSWQLEAEYSQPEFRSALQTELRRSLRETVDKLALAGKASAPAVEGFLATLTDPTNPSAVAEMKDLIDVFVPSPPWSSTPAEPRLACNRDVIKYFMSLSDSTQVVVWDRDVLSPSVATSEPESGRLPTFPSPPPPLPGASGLPVPVVLGGPCYPFGRTGFWSKICTPIQVQDCAT